MSKVLNIAAHMAQQRLENALLDYQRAYGRERTVNFLASYVAPEDKPLKAISHRAWRENQETHGGTAEPEQDE